MDEWINEIGVGPVLLIGVLFGILIAWLIHRAVVWCRAWWYRWLGRKGEASAESLLKAAGYTIVDAQLRLPCSYLVDDEAVPYAVRVVEFGAIRG